ncbi:MAG: AMP-binding protein [Deltaproteobacteria bacterium]|nr:AMP-binding protein [Deltaproteobacteria bacterium]
MPDNHWRDETIGAALDAAARKYGDRVASVFHHGPVTYQQVKETSDRLARGFLALGIGKGDRVAVWMAGYAEWAFVYFALTRIGAIIVPVNTRYRPDEMGIKKLISPYGLTETHIGGTACALDDSLELRMTTVGRPMPGVEIAIRQVDGKNFLPQGQPGEVCFKGWCNTKGYYDDPEKTAEAIDDEGWFRTGDLGVIGADGYLRLIGRIKDMIRVGGENVAAVEVEAVLLKHPAVKQAVAVGRADPRLAEVVAAFVELKLEQSSSETELIAHCRQHLASFKVPRRIIFVTDWPMTGAGKIQRYVLKEKLAAESQVKI